MNPVKGWAGKTHPLAMDDVMAKGDSHPLARDADVAGDDDSLNF